MASSFRDDELILNYHDAVVYGSDLSLLESPTSWLNDACINFQMTRLSFGNNDGGGDDDGSSGGGGDKEKDTESSSDLYMDPSVVSFLMHQCHDEEDMSDLNQGLNLHTKKRLFVPINDVNAGSAKAFRTPGGGSHWSLLFVTIITTTTTTTEEERRVVRYLHFDSCRGNNTNAATKVAEKLHRLLKLAFATGNAAADVISSPIKTDGGISVHACNTPQQRNGYDCGIFTLAIAEALSTVSLVELTSSRDNDDDVVVSVCERAVEQFVSYWGGTTDIGPRMRGRIAGDVRSIIAQKK